MKNSKIKLVKTALLAMTTVSALALAACSDEDKETTTDSGVEYTETNEEVDNDSEEFDDDGDEVTGDEKKEIQKVARSFYVDVYSFDMEEMINSEQPDIVKGNILDYNDEQYGQLAEALSVYYDDILPQTNYEELSNKDKANFLISLGEMQGKMMLFGDLVKGVSAQTSGETVVVDGNTATVTVSVEITMGGTSEAFGDDVPESAKEEIHAQLVKTSDGWKIDAGSIAQEYQEKIDSRFAGF